uniref:Transposase n=1 Tax=OCS116 cluster bacterium TaxID=2030921 RepID=A0A2A4YZW3_9PROT
MSNIRHIEKFKRNISVQTTDIGCSVNEVSERQGINTKSLYDWNTLSIRSPVTQTIGKKATIRAAPVRIFIFGR